ncbi:MAG TPA: hypothetical protein VN541_14745 [Tepidisphaeraceae bacterium]|nr:hypothetical protein [Tepidisphaeraceae bacterium]
MTNSILPYEPSKQPPIGRQVFGVIVRVIGLLVALWGVLALAWAAGETRFALVGHYTPATYLIFGLVYLALGILLIRGEWLVRFAYGGRAARSEG